MNDALLRYPDRFRASTQTSQCYRRLLGHYAVHGSVPEMWRARVVFSLVGDGIAICVGDSNSVVPVGVQVSPVYALEPSGSPAVPTGRVLVRYAEVVMAEQRSPELEHAGYRVARILDYAPHTAWVVAKSGDIADALHSISILEGLAGVVNVEPEMLTQRNGRGWVREESGAPDVK